MGDVLLRPFPCRCSPECRPSFVSHLPLAVSSTCQLAHSIAGGARGSQVKVSHMWSVRNFWEWLQPGHDTQPQKACTRGAFIHYSNLANYRDFCIQKVVLWAGFQHIP